MPTQNPAWDVEVFFDGACPLCRREVELLRRRDGMNRIRTTDIAAPDFDADALGVPLETLMGEIHGRLPNGDWIRGVEVFRRLYGAVGLRRAVAISRWPLVSSALDVAYRGFARHRLRLTGRCDDVACGVTREHAPSGPSKDALPSTEWSSQ